MRGVVLCAMAIAEPSAENATELPVEAGTVAGLAYLVPKPAAQG